MDQKRIVDHEGENSTSPPMTGSPARLRSQSTGSQIKSVLLFSIDTVELASDEFSPQYDLPALKTLALNHMRGELAKCDIVEESFGRFTSQ